MLVACWTSHLLSPKLGSVCSQRSHWNQHIYRQRRLHPQERGVCRVSAAFCKRGGKIVFGKDIHGQQQRSVHPSESGFHWLHFFRPPSHPLASRDPEH